MALMTALPMSIKTSRGAMQIQELDHRAEAIDKHVGQRVQTMRRSLKISRAELARGIGLSFQQVQKYERGANRISASKLFQIAELLETPVGYFFEGISPEGKRC